jgi:hypothetical protein
MNARSRRGGGVDRLARACVAAAARRWPAELAGTMRREWDAELDALRTDAVLGSLTRARRALLFAVSLLVSPAVEPAGTAPRTWRDRAAGPVRALTGLSAVAGITLLAAALFNVVHDANHGLAQLVPPAARTLANVGLLAAAALAMWLVAGVAAERSRSWLPNRPATAAVGCTAVVGLAMYAFLLAGNRVAVMPFMGWVDLAPGVAAWVVLTAVAAGVAARVAASGRRRLSLATGAAGALAALEATAICGSLHAAKALGVGFGSAPAWFPLALLPGGTVSFGGLFADGTASFGAFHASKILLGNVSAMVGPLLLCSVFLAGYTTHRATAPTPHRASTAGTVTAGLGLAAATTWGYLAAHNSPPTAVLARLADNSAVFGFGFASHLAGRIGLAIVLGVVISRLTAATPQAPHRPG